MLSETADGTAAVSAERAQDTDTQRKEVHDHPSQAQGSKAAESSPITVSLGRSKVKSRASKHRRLQSSCRSNLIVAGKVLLLFAVAAGYFLSSFTIEQQEFQYQSTLMPEHTYLMRRNTMMRDIAYLSRQLALAPLMQQEFRPESVAKLAGIVCCSRLPIP